MINKENLNSEFEFNQFITTREGYKVDVSSDLWHLPYARYEHASINFELIFPTEFKNSVKEFIIHQLSHTSTHAGLSSFKTIYSEVFSNYSDDELKGCSSKEVLVKLFETALNKSKKEKKLYALYRAIKWYLWSVKNSNDEELFSKQYARQLEGIIIPGNPKGEAVRSLNPERGPLDRSLELQLIINALKNDSCNSFSCLQEKAAVALSIALGRNPSNLCYLRESDLCKLTPFSEVEPTYMIKVPRIKKRQLSPRDDYLEEYLDPFYGKIIEQLISANRTIKLTFNGFNYKDSDQRPLFINESGNKVAIKSFSQDEVFNMTSGQISKLLQSFVSRHNIISPITKKPLKVSARRFRYTLATSLASEGISTKELARILDHSDTQNVQVYYDTRNSIVAHLDKALSQQFAKYVNLFQGKVISDKTEAINGDRDDKQLIFVDEEKLSQPTDIGVCGNTSICHLDPPFSCYLCPKFQPYRSADHDYVLERLLESREQRLKKYENARLGVQLDDVIIAVTNVINICKEA